MEEGQERCTGEDDIMERERRRKRLEMKESGEERGERREMLGDKGERRRGDERGAVASSSTQQEESNREEYSIQSKRGRTGHDLRGIFLCREDLRHPLEELPDPLAHAAALAAAALLLL